METAPPLSRRAFFGLARPPEPPRLCPPGVALSDLAACSGCGKCAEACPTGVLAMQGGLPALDFARAECTFCGKCAQSCPEPVFANGVAQRFPHVMAIGPDCLTYMGVDCQACRDGCPAEAIRFRPRRGGPFLPELDSAACTGCGACVSLCPAAAISLAQPQEEVAHA